MSQVYVFLILSKGCSSHQAVEKGWAPELSVRPGTGGGGPLKRAAPPVAIFEGWVRWDDDPATRLSRSVIPPFEHRERWAASFCEREKEG